MKYDIFNLKNIYRSKFLKNGFVLLKNYFSQHEAKQIVKYADDLQLYEEVLGKWMIYHEVNKNNQKQKSRIENIVNYHKGVNNLLTHRVNSTLNFINGYDMTLFKDKLNWKSPGGQGFNAHQDQNAWSDFPPSQYVTVALFADKSNLKNGCLEFAEGLEKRNYIMDSNSENLGELTNEIEESLNWKPIISNPSDMLIFDSYVPHRSGKNNSKKSRRIFYFTYHKSYFGNFYDDYIKKKRIEFPPDFERTTDKIINKNNKYNLANPFN